ncbi:MAG: DUF2085 domain-containing protein [Anaerolineae bacterium]
MIKRLTPPGGVLTWIAFGLLIVVSGVWLALTPEGILGKADAVGYAVCHRITVRSFAFPDGRTLPMCARCTGTFLGVLIALLVPPLLLGRKRAGNLPPIPLILVLLGFSAWWAFDGSNSFMHLLPTDLPLPRLFEPNNFLRVTTGTLHGITMGTLMLPIFIGTIWKDASCDRVIDCWWHLAVMVGIGIVVIAVVYAELPLFLYPLAVFSAAGTLTILALIATVLVITVLGRENDALTIGDALPLIVLGLALTIILIGGIDALRFAMFGSWEGLVL